MLLQYLPNPEALEHRSSDAIKRCSGSSPVRLLDRMLCGVGRNSKARSSEAAEPHSSEYVLCKDSPVRRSGEIRHEVERASKAQIS